jgi:hypothetical protein
MQVLENVHDMGCVEAELISKVRCLVGLEHALLAKVGEQFTPGYVLHEDVETAGILGEAFEVHLNGRSGTMKGWLILLRMRYSLEM